MGTKKNLINLTKDGLPVVSEKTIMEYLKTEGITHAENNREVTKRIKEENPAIYKILKIAMEEAKSYGVRPYFADGVQLTYELLRRQSVKNK